MDYDYPPSTPRGFYTLNILRICSIISLLSSIVAATATLIKSFTATHFFFFDALSHVILSTVCIFLLLSECSLAAGYFQKNWPLFSKDSTLVWQGLALVAVGFCLLGNLNEDFASKEILGTNFNTLLVASGVITSMVGVCTFIASFVFHDKHANITARTIRSIRRHRQTRRSHGASPVIRTPTPRLPESGGGAIQLPERSYSFRSQQESESESLYKLYGRFAESETSSRYSASVRDAKDIAGRYQKELGLGVV